MTTMTLSQIEQHATELTLSEQLWLVERLIHHIRAVSVLTEQVIEDDDLFAMAYDPQIQRENHIIGVEFSITEGDGLDVI